MTSDAAVTVSNLGVRFQGLWAVNDVSLSIPQGQRRAIIGPNGAGKTTLVHLISGVHRPTTGSIALFGEDVTKLSQHGRARRGLGRTYQITNIFGDLTVLENAYLGVQALERQKWIPSRFARRYTSALDRAEEIVAHLGLQDQADRLASEMSYGEQRQLEVALALATSPKVLLLDEPLAGLSEAERAVMRQIIQDIDRRVTLLLIEHNMEIVMEVSDVVTVLHHGEIVAEGTPEETRRDEQVRRIYLGASVA